MSNIVKFVGSILLAFLAGGIGSLATVPNITTWYAALDKPFFNPPNWVFGPVWTVLYVLMGLSFYLVWRAPYKKSKRAAVGAFFVQLALNALWSLVFFGLHLPWLAVAVIVCLLVAIWVCMRLFWRISKPAASLLVPYLLWVTFATCLNVGVAVLN